MIGLFIQGLIYILQDNVKCTMMGHGKKKRASSKNGEEIKYSTASFEAAFSYACNSFKTKNSHFSQVSKSYL